MLVPVIELLGGSLPLAEGLDEAISGAIV